MNSIPAEKKLRLELAKPLVMLGFEPGLEAEFRASLRADRRLPRALFYLFPLLVFGLAPFYGQRMFETPAELIPLFRLLEYGFFVPLCLIAALADYLPNALRFSRLMHTLTVPALWLVVILLRRASLNADFYFPASILGIFMIGAAVLCGFRFRLMLVGILIATGLSFISELSMESSVRQSVLWMDALLQVLLAALAIIGTWFNERLYRRLWLQSRLVELASRTDALTGLTTRAEFNRRFAQLYAQARRQQLGLAVMLLDIDRFKQINDRYGHLYGDEVLRAVGQAVADTAARRPLDIAARYGGEEMVAVWYDIPAEAIAVTVSRVLDRIRAIRLPVAESGDVPPVSASAGVVHLVPDHDRTPEDVLHIADMLMYAAKRDGRDRFSAQIIERPAAMPPQGA